MQSLPSALIGNLASYLKFYDYTSFQTANKTIYTECNTPNTLRHLYLLRINDYSGINLAKYPHLRRLSIKLNAFDSFVLPANGETVCNRLQEILLDAEKQPDADFTNFLTQNAINTTNVTSLECRGFGDSQHHFSFDTFTRLLSKFSNIEHLSLIGVALFPHASFPPVHLNLLQLLPRLHTFSWFGSKSSTFLVDALRPFGAKLKTLYFRDNMIVPLPQHISDITFPNLQQLHISSPRIVTLDHILKTTKYLRKIKFTFHQSFKFTTFPIKASIQKLLATQPLLEYIGSGCSNYGALYNTCTGFERGLHDRKYKNKNIRLEIFLRRAVVDIAKYKHMLFMIVRITKQLRALDVENWMLCFSAKCDDTKLTIRKASIEFEQKHSDMTVHHQASKSYFRIVVSNTGCTFNGTKEPFLWYS